MKIDEQVELLMQGTEYGDEALKQAMATELRERLLDLVRRLLAPSTGGTQLRRRSRPAATRPFGQGQPRGQSAEDLRHGPSVQ